MRDNEEENIIYDQPTTIERRIEVAQDFVGLMDYDIEVVVDSMDDQSEQAYAAWPERLYVIGADGRIAYKGGMGPDGFDIDEVEDWLRSEFPTSDEEPDLEEGQVDEQEDSGDVSEDSKTAPKNSSE